ncbi:MAG TPA: hypothetical protein VH116_05495 [Gemmatimonadales bacterium]|nr:hypothetical protein [Gemmatimonadales bacterium]
MRSAPALYGAALALFGLGAFLRLAPPALPPASAADLPGTGLPAARVAAEPAPPTYDAIVRGNMFSQRRTPPAVRFTPAGAPHAARRARAEGGAPPTLYGITQSPRGAVALIHADPRRPGAELYRVGDWVAGARVVAITDSTVTLAQSSGPILLHLASGRRPTP